MRPLRRILAAGVLLALTGLVVIGWREARSDPVVRQAIFTTARLPHDTPPLRVVLISDVHVGNWAMPASRLQRIVDQINALHPDAVLIAGDLVNGYSPHNRDFRPWDMVVPLSHLKSRLGTFAMLGNHDTATAPATVVAALHRAGVTVLRNQATRVGPIALIGVEMDRMDSWDMAPLMDEARGMGGLPVIMTHAPPGSAQVPRAVPLVLAGHTHCGQVVFPGFDNSFDYLHWEQRYESRFRCGLVQTPDYTIVVTAGLGAATIPPLRLNAPPDLWLITIRAG
jgi:predicted MPP superfamily phosphohydrolase